MKKTIYLKMTIDWENYDDVIDELIIEDSGVLDSLKEGVSIEQIKLQELKVDEIRYVDDGLADDDYLLDLRKK
jgi:hypothetical protein